MKKFSYILLIIFILNGCNICNNSPCLHVRIKYDKNSNLPYINLLLNDIPTKAFVDTGGNFEVTADKSLLHESQLRPQHVKMSGLNGKINTLKTYNGKITINSISFHNLIIQEYKDWSYNISEYSFDNHTIRNYIGIGLFKLFSFRLDFRNDSIALYHHNTNALNIFEYTHSTPFELTSNGIEFVMLINNIHLKCVLDSGATHSMLFRGGCHKLSIKHPALPDTSPITVPILSMGTLTKINMKFITPNLENPHFDVLLGMDFLKEHDVFIDFRRQRIWFS